MDYKELKKEICLKYCNYHNRFNPGDIVTDRVAGKIKIVRLISFCDFLTNEPQPIYEIIQLKKDGEPKKKPIHFVSYGNNIQGGWKKPDKT